MDALLQLVDLIGRLRSPVNEAGGEAWCQLAARQRPADQQLPVVIGIGERPVT